jgi:hypothetical protein
MRVPLICGDGPLLALGQEADSCLLTVCVPSSIRAVGVENSHVRFLGNLVLNLWDWCATLTNN